MTVPLRLIVTGEQAIMGAAFLGTGLGVRVTQLNQHLVDWSPRDRASEYFRALYRSSLEDTPLLLRGAWLDEPYGCQPMPRALQRVLERFALGLGVVVASTDGTPCTSLPMVPVPDEIGEVGDVLELARERRWLNLGPGSGAWRPGEVTLLVGDRPNHGAHGDLKHRLPFFSLHSGGCSHWLANQLEQAHVAESELYWINSADANGVPTLANFLEVLRPRQVIALGRNAADWCADALRHDRAPFHFVNHPQHHKRFNAGERYPLLDVLTS